MDICASLRSQGEKDRGLIVVPQTHCPSCSSPPQVQVPRKTTKESKTPFHPLAGMLARAYPTLSNLCLSGNVAVGLHTKGRPNGTFFGAFEWIASTSFEVCFSCSNNIFLVYVPHGNVISELFMKPGQISSWKCHTGAFAYGGQVHWFQQGNPDHPGKIIDWHGWKR